MLYKLAMVFAFAITIYYCYEFKENDVKIREDVLS